MLNFLVVFLLSLFFTMPSFAESIVFKNGKSVEAKIIEKTPDSIKVDIKGIPITYYLEDLEFIDGIKVVIPKKINQKPLVEENVNNSDNIATSVLAETPDEELLKYGMKFFPPVGWIKNKNIKSEMGEIINFSSPKEESQIQITVPYRISFKKYQDKVFKNKKNPKFVFEKEIEFLGVPCQIYYQDTKTEIGIVRLKFYLFFKDNMVYSFQYLGFLDKTFNEDISDFEKALNNIEITNQIYFEHMSGLFKIIPPPDFKVEKHSPKGVSFVRDNVRNSSYFSVSFQDIPHGYTDEEYSTKLEDNEYIQSVIDDMEKKGWLYGMKVVETRKRFVNGIMALEYVVENKNFLFPMRGESVVFIKNQKMFTIVTNSRPELYEGVEKDFEKALKTLKIQ